MQTRHFEEGPTSINSTNVIRTGSCSGTSAVVSTATSTGVSRYGWRYATGYSLKNFRERKAAGELLPMLPWTSVQCRGEVTPGVEVYTSSKQCGVNPFTCGTLKLWDHEWKGSGTFDPKNDIWPSWGITPQEAYDHLDSLGIDPHYYVQQAAAAIYASGWDGLTFASEFHKTVSMFINAKKRFAKLVEDAIFRRKLPRKPRNISEALSIASRDWLEYRYGWRILIMDLEEIAKAVKGLGEQRTRFSERKGVTFNDATASTYSYAAGDFIATRHDIIEWKVGVRGSVTADAEIASARFNPIITGWEVIPFSFIIDWFIHINQALEALSFYAVTTKHVAATGVEIMGFKTTGDLYTATLKSPCSGGSQSVYTPPTWVRKSTIHIKQRSPTTVNTRPQMRLRLNFAKGLDVLALIKQLVIDGRKPPRLRYG